MYDCEAIANVRGQGHQVKSRDSHSGPDSWTFYVWKCVQRGHYQRLIYKSLSSRTPVTTIAASTSNVTSFVELPTVEPPGRGNRLVVVLRSWFCLSLLQPCRSTTAITAIRISPTTRLQSARRTAADASTRTTSGITTRTGWNSKLRTSSTQRRKLSRQVEFNRILTIAWQRRRRRCLRPLTPLCSLEGYPGHRALRWMDATLVRRSRASWEVPPEWDLLDPWWWGLECGRWVLYLRWWWCGWEVQGFPRVDPAAWVTKCSARVKW